jgi:hypothetical protein
MIVNIKCLAARRTQAPPIPTSRKYGCGSANRSGVSPSLFDPAQSTIILCGDNNQGMSQTLFNKTLIRKADTRFSAWLKEKHHGH